eukprot:1675238-Prymnesium_polylepis.1
MLRLSPRWRGPHSFNIHLGIYPCSSSHAQLKPYARGWRIVSCEVVIEVACKSVYVWSERLYRRFTISVYASRGQKE